MTDEELIARLRDAKRDWPEFGHDRAEAADRIEAQAAEIERLRGVMAKLTKASDRRHPPRDRRWRNQLLQRGCVMTKAHVRCETIFIHIGAKP